jgi:hypothetical protein
MEDNFNFLMKVPGSQCVLQQEISKRLRDEREPSSVMVPGGHAVLSSSALEGDDCIMDQSQLDDREQ